MAVTYNLKGTTNSSFQIGKKGVVLTPADNTSATTVTFPNATGTLVLQDSTDTLSNKSFSGNIAFDTNTLFVDADNNRVGIGTTSPAIKLSVEGTSADVASFIRGNNSGSGQIHLGNSDGYVRVGGADGSFTVYNSTNTSARLYIDNTGKVGIGNNTSPTEELDVTGDGAFSGNVTITGNLTVNGTTTTVNSTQVNVQNAFVFEGATADEFETTLTVTDPTADRTITLPDATTTLVGTDTTDTLTNKTLGATTIAGHLIPDTNITYDLGTSSLRFRDIYLSGTTIDLGGAKLTNDGSDNLDIKDSSGNRKIIRASAIELVDSSGKKMKLERDATTGKLKQTRKNADDSDEGSTDTLDIVGDTSPQLGGTLDANGNDIDMGTNTITDTKVGQWDTAYGWGDHSTQSYLSGTVGFPTDLGAVTGSTTNYLGLGPDLGSIASGDTFVGLAKDFGLFGETVTTTSTQTLTNKTLSAPTVTGNVAFDTDTLFVDATNNRVGIGTTSPSYTLDVTDGTAKIDNLTVGDTDEGRIKITGAGKIELRDTNSMIQESSGILLWNNAAGRTVRMATSGTERMRVATDGNVGIGTTSPSSTLDVNGNVTISGNLTVNGTTTTVDSTTVQIQNAFVFEGATADDFETTLTVVDPTADRTITLPNATGTVALTNSFTHFHSSAQTVTSGEATTNASGTVDYTFSELSGAIHYVAFLNRTLMRASEYSVSGTTLTVTSGVLATDDQIEVTGISV